MIIDPGLLSGIIVATATVIAAFIAKEWKKDRSKSSSEINPQKLRSKKASRINESHYEFVGLRHLLKKGIPIEKIIGDLIAIDYQAIRNIEDRDVGSLSQWRPIVESNLDCWGLVIARRNNIVGYWHFMALRQEFFKRALHGDLHDGELRLDAIELLVKPGRYNLYLIIVAVVVEHRGCAVNRLLLQGLCERLLELAKLGIYFDEMVTNAYTEDGLALCRHLGMDYVCDHRNHGKIYRLALNPLPDCFALIPELRSFYTKTGQKVMG
jgi:hypothetical protein